MTSTASVAKRAARAFTLIEVLAALAFMAIVIPVTLQGLSVASRAGEMADRKAVAMRIAERVLNEQIVTGQWKVAGQRGSVEQSAVTYNWVTKATAWDKGNMRQVTVTVTFPVRGDDFDLTLSTLADSSITTQ